MAKQKANHHMPKWMWNMHIKELNRSTKEFYAYLCIFGPNTNWQWNCRLQKKFGVSRRTIQYWLAKLKKLRLIWIESGDGRNRKIHCRYYRNPLEWFQDLAMPRATRELQKRRFKRCKKLHP